jgi:hypothetical protein
MYRVWLPLPFHKSIRVAHPDALHTKVTLYHIVEIRVLKDNAHRTGDYAISTIRALLLIDDITASLIPKNSILRADFRTFSALRTNIRAEFTRIGKFGLYPQRCFFGIYFKEVLDRADLQAKPAASAIISIDFYPHHASLMYPSHISQSATKGRTFEGP